MKNKLLVILALFICQIITAQISPSLVTQIRNDKITRAWTFTPVPTLPWITYKVKAHVISASSTPNGKLLTEQQVEQSIEKLNDNFRQARINFVMCAPVNFVIHNSYSNLDVERTRTNPTTGLVENYQDNSQRDYLMSNYNNSATINIYYVRGINDFDDGYQVKGFTYLPLQNINFIAIDYKEALTCVPTHEMGHYLGLLHTHETAFGLEHVDGTNCYQAGDLLCDTKADPKIKPAEKKYTVTIGNTTGWYHVGGIANVSYQNGINVTAELQNKYIVTKCPFGQIKTDILSYNPISCPYVAYTNPALVAYSDVYDHINDTRDHIYHVIPIASDMTSWDELGFEFPNGKQNCESVAVPNGPIPNFGGCLGCLYFGTEKDPKGSSYTPPIPNYMSYASCSCTSVFTPEQTNEMHYWSSTPNRLALQYFANTGLINQTVSANLSMSGERIYIENVNITNNANVYIDHCNLTTIIKNFEVAEGTTLTIK